MVDPAHGARAHDARGVQGQLHDGVTSDNTMRGDRAHGDTPLRIYKEEKEGVFAAHNPDLIARLREKGNIE
jgi:hypothetical protein